MFVECNKSKFHRWCSSCVKNGFGIDFEKLLQNNTTCWPKGCPICTNSCHCSLCRKRSLGKMAQNEATMATCLLDIMHPGGKPAGQPRKKAKVAPKPKMVNNLMIMSGGQGHAPKPMAVPNFTFLQPQKLSTLNSMPAQGQGPVLPSPAKDLMNILVEACGETPPPPPTPPTPPPTTTHPHRTHTSMLVRKPIPNS